MKCKRLNEVIELLQPAWQKEPELNLMQFLQKLAKEAGYDGELSDLSDDIPDLSPEDARLFQRCCHPGYSEGL